MTPQETLDAVRTLSENATLRPGAKQLRLTRGIVPVPRRVIIAYEELHPPVIGGWGRPHQDPPKQRRVEPVFFKGEKVKRAWTEEKAAKGRGRA